MTDERKIIWESIIFGVVMVALLSVIMFALPVFATISPATQDPVPAGFTVQSAGALLGIGLLLAALMFAFTPILAAEFIVVRAGNIRSALEVAVIIAGLTAILLLVIADGPLVAISFVISLPFAAVLSAKIPVETRKRRDRFTWS